MGIDLGRVLSTVEAIKGMRRQGQMQDLQAQYLQHRIDNAPAEQQRAVAQEQRAAAAEQRTETEWQQAQRLSKLQFVNSAMAEIEANPAKFQHYLPQLVEAGEFAQGVDVSSMTPEQIQESARELREATSQALASYNPNMQTVAASHQNTLDQIKAREESEMRLASQPKPVTPTDDMREYEYARSQGFNGSLADYQQRARGAQASEPLETIMGEDGKPKLVPRSQAVGMQPYRDAVKDPVADRSQKASNVLGIVSEAEKLLDSATGSYLGAGIDQAARFFGSSTDGAKAISELKVFEANLMMAQPRMEGPQSNLDVQLYREAAAQIGDPTVPPEQKRAALNAIKRLYSKYAAQGEQGAAAPKQGGSGGWTIEEVS